MAKYHINPRTGNPGICRAHKQCPFGGESEHYGSESEARQAYEAIQSGATFTPATRVIEPDVAIEANPSEFDTVSFRGFNRSAGAVSAGARGLMGGIMGGKSYSETIAAAKERASYATAYFDKKADKSEGSSRVLEGNSTLASAAVANRTSGALSAARAARADSSRMLAHATPAVDNVDAVKAALRSKGAAKVTSPIGAAAGSFSW
jgi:hypothetical protein